MTILGYFVPILMSTSDAQSIHEGMLARGGYAVIHDMDGQEFSKLTRVWVDLTQQADGDTMFFSPVELHCPPFDKQKQCSA